MNTFNKDGEMEIKQLDLNELIENETSSDEEDADEDKKSLLEKDLKIEKSQENTKVVKDSFFLGGDASDDASENESDNDQDITEFSIDNAVNNKRNNFFEKSKLDRSRGHEGHRGRGRSQSSDRGRGDFKRGRGDFKRGSGDFNRGRGDYNRGRGDYNRGHGDFSRGRGNFGRGRSDFNRGRGSFSGDRGDFNRGRGTSNRGRGSFDSGRGRGLGNYENEEFSNEKIHPSWAAKRNQQKVVISTENLSNKKIKFDDSGDSSSFHVTKKHDTSVSEEKNMHPSWAAKKSSKQGIQQCQGKKVVFGDDD